MEEQLYADRAALRCLMRTQPRGTQREWAAHLGRSVGWVKKWARRLRAAPPGDSAVLRSRSRAHKAPYHTWPEAVIARILEIRDQPPDGLRRVPGPRAILYYLHRDAQLSQQGAELPRSTRTVWRILDRNGRIVHRSPAEHEPLGRPAPLTQWQLDFKDASTVPADPEGKRMHVVEVLDTLDVGTSILLGAEPREDYTAETSLYAMADLVRQIGLPDHVTFDRDTRFVGAVQARDFPAPFVRFWLCPGVGVTICPPHHPQTQGFVERYHRSYTAECLRVERPATVEEVCMVTAAYRAHYNWQRPNQALSCGNQPPRVAFPTLPARPSVPLLVDPDAWLGTIDGRGYVRRVQENGGVTVAEALYDVGRERAGQEVAVLIDAPAREFAVVQAGQEVKRLPIKGLYGGIVPFDTFVELLARQARENRAARWRATG
jgi:hypothetical protein